MNKHFTMASRAISKKNMRSLILHFDVNKTICICDPVQNINCCQLLNSIISEAAFGTVPQSTSNTLTPSEKQELALLWKPLAIKKDAMLLKSNLAEDISGSIATFSDFLELNLKMEKSQRKKLKTTFTEEGQVGNVHREVYNTLLQHMRIQKPGLSSECVTSIVSKESPEFHFLLPSFLFLVKTLHGINRDFSIVFRTFGIDLPEVCAEFNQFCEGKHPLYPDCFLDGRDGKVDRRVTIPQMKLNRNSSGGTTLQLNSTDEIHGADAITDKIEQLAFGGSAKGCTIALQDDYSYWSSKGEADEAGKFLRVSDPRNKNITNSIENEPHHIFFDDNIERNRSHIVDVRHRRSDIPLTFNEANDLFIVRVEPIHAIQNVNYFLDKVEICENHLNQLIKEA